MFIKKLQKKNISLIRILLYIVLIISFFSVGYHLFTYGISNIHSDNAVELTAIESIFTNKDIFPSSWIYGNGDINLMRIQVFLVLPFIFLENWAIAREIGALFSVLCGAYGLFILSRKVLKNDMWLLAIPLYTVCYTGRCRDVILDSSMYSSVMFYGTLSIAFGYYLYSVKCKAKFKLIVGMLLLFLLNIGGVRWMAEITLPLIFTVIVYFYLEKKHMNYEKSNIQVMSLLKVLLCIIIPSLIGVAVFLYVNLKCHFVVNTVSGVGLVPSLEGLLNNFLVILGNFFACFGYNGGCSLLSIYGIRDFISVFICMVLCFVVPICCFNLMSTEKGSIKFTLLFAYIHNVIIFVVAIFTSKTQVYHVITIVFYCIIIFAIYSSKYILRPECYDRYLWVFLFTFVIIIESICLVKDSSGWH